MKKVTKKIVKSSSKKQSAKVQSKSPIAVVIISMLIILASITYLASQLIPTKRPDINETVTAFATPVEDVIYEWSFDSANDFGTKGWELYGYTTKNSAQKAKLADGSIVIPGAINKNVSLLVNDLTTKPKVGLKDQYLNKPGTNLTNLVVEIDLKYLSAPISTISSKTPTAQGIVAIPSINPKHIVRLGLSNANQFITTVKRENKKGNEVSSKAWTWKALASQDQIMFNGDIPGSTIRFTFTEQDLAKIDNVASMQLILNPAGDSSFGNVVISHIKIKKVSAKNAIEKTTGLGTVSKSNLEGQLSYNLTLDGGGIYELRSKKIMQDPEKSKYAGVSLDPLEAFIGKKVEVIGVLTYPAKDTVGIPRANNPILTIETITAK
jgi:hypothetical protein